MNKGVKRYREWLVYSPLKDCAFCFSCWNFADKRHSNFDPAFSNPNLGFSNWKKATNKLCVHEKSEVHMKAYSEMISCRYRLAKGATVAQQQISAYEENIKKNREILKRLLDIILYLAKQNLALRGHKESKFSDIGKEAGINDGNFIELVKLLGKYDAVLAKHLCEAPGNQTYLSPQIQNEFISAINLEILSNIISEVQKAKYFGIVMDSTIDVANLDQVSFSVRYVDSDFQIQERFFKFTDIVSSKSEDLIATLQDMLTELDLDIQMIRSQANDRAANMSGKLSGLQTRVKEVNDLAYYVHCCAHRLNLALAASCDHVTEAVSFFGLIEKLYVFITGSQPRFDTF